MGSSRLLPGRCTLHGEEGNSHSVLEEWLIGKRMFFHLGFVRIVCKNSWQMWEKGGSPRNRPVKSHAWCLGQSSLESVGAFPWISVGFGGSQWLKTKQELLSFLWTEVQTRAGSSFGDVWTERWLCLGGWKRRILFRVDYLNLVQQQPRLEHHTAASRALG